MYDYSLGERPIEGPTLDCPTVARHCNMMCESRSAFGSFERSYLLVRLLRHW